MIEFVSRGTKVKIHQSKYIGGGRLALVGLREDGDLYARLTVNLPNEPLDKGEFFVKTWSGNEQFARDAMATGKFINTGRKVPTGFVMAEIWKLADPGEQIPGVPE
jgi:hypothetical protein